MKGAGLFDPHALGVHPRSLSTACWRGFHCLYEVTDAAIGLRELAIGLDAGDAAKAERGELPGLAGAVPEKDQRSGHVYKSLAVKVPFTGGILLADGFIQNLYVHMGFHPAWKYREVHELLFEDGRLLHAQDRSAAMASLRSSRARRRALAATRPARRSSAGSRGPSASTTPGSCRRRSSPRSVATSRVTSPRAAARPLSMNVEGASHAVTVASHRGRGSGAEPFSPRVRLQTTEPHLHSWRGGDDPDERARFEASDAAAASSRL